MEGRATRNPAKMRGWPGWGSRSNPDTESIGVFRTALGMDHRPGCGTPFVRHADARRKGTHVMNDADNTTDDGHGLPASGDEGSGWDGQITIAATTVAEVPALVTAYREAVVMADALRRAMDRAGLTDPAVLVVPSLTEDGTPVAVLTLSPGAVRRIDALIASGTPPPDWERAA